MGLSSLIFSNKWLQSFNFLSTKSEELQRLAHQALEPDSSRISNLLIMGEPERQYLLLGIVFHFPRNMSDYTVFTEGDAVFVFL